MRPTRPRLLVDPTCSEEQPLITESEDDEPTLVEDWEFKHHQDKRQQSEG